LDGLIPIVSHDLLSNYILKGDEEAFCRNDDAETKIVLISPGKRSAN
jgi:hypothetical protein